MGALISGSWQEQPSTTTVSTTRPTSSRPTTVSTIPPTSNRPTTVSTTQFTRPPTNPQTRPPTTSSTTTTTTTTTTRVPLATTTVDVPGENGPQQTTHRPTHSNRPWWSEYHTQRPGQQQPQQPQRPCKSGTFRPSADDCHSYYQCKNGRFRKYSCSDGSLWNRNMNRCDTPKNVNCNEPGEYFFALNEHALFGTILGISNR